MIRAMALAAVTLAGAACTDSALPTADGPPPTLAITSVNVVDVVGGAILRDRTIVVAGDRTLGVIQRAPLNLPLDARVIDGEGLYAIPGLWDMHIHMINDETTPAPWDFHEPDSARVVSGEVDAREIYMPIYLAFGVTGTREMSGGLASLELRERIRRGEILGPHMVVGSPMLDGPVPTFPDGAQITLDSPARAQEVVEELHAQGFDFLKPYSLLPAETYRALIQRADEVGMPVAGELPLQISAWEAAELGQRSIEHLTGIEFAASSREEELRAQYTRRIEALNGDSPPKKPFGIWNRSEWEPLPSLDLAKQARLFAHLAAHDTWVVPTLVVQRMISYSDDPVLAGDPNLRYTDPWSRDLASLTEEFDPERRLRPVYDHRAGVIDDLHAAGVGILAGSDTPGGFTLLDELEIFQDGGLTPLEALRTATMNPARYLGREDEVGVVASGRFADIVLLRANPLEDIRNLRLIEAVIFQGHVLDRAQLDRMLVQLADDAASWPE